MIYDDLRVVDSSTGIAGAYCAKLLTDLGADVVFGRAVNGDPLFTYLRTSQRHAADLEPWLTGADIVITNEPHAYDAPHADPYVTIVISALGHGGPDDRLDLPEEVLQARSGSLSAHGHADRPPLTVGGRLGEYIVGAYAALGGLTALRRGTRGEVVDASMLEAIQMTYVTTPTLMARFPGGRKVSHRWVMIPGNEPAAAGRYVGITTITAQQWQALARVIGRDDMAADDELATMIGRYLRNAEVNGALHAYTEPHDADDIVAACVEARVPVAIVGNGAELPRNEQLVARNVFVKQPGASWIRPRAPFRFHAVADRPLAPTAAAGDPWGAPRERVQTGAGPRPLEGLRVLDFTAFWAGPHATAWLCAMGADVIKVEAVQRPDGIRFSAAVRPHEDPQFYEKSALFHFCNLGKRGITLDLSHPDGLALAKQLVERSDIVAENFTPQVMERFGLDWDTVHALNPRAVYLRMPAFGLDGPWRSRGGFAQTMEQLTGMAWVTGYEGGPPIIPGGPVDPMVGAHAALAVVAALEHRARTGAGQLVEVPLVEVATAVTAEQVIRYAIDGTLLGRRGEGGVYKCAGDDEWVAIDRRSDPMSPDERSAWCASRAPNAAAKEALAQGVPAAAMVPGFATLDDPQMRARGFFEAIVHEHVGEQHYPTWPVRLSGGPDQYWRGPAPTLGEHTQEVLRELLGVDDDELARLEAAHVIGTVPRMGR
jgi:crotonobetainyl-CoA:carnitine CoA-transferase CaiB-like acyl-CoA transferase